MMIHSHKVDIAVVPFGVEDGRGFEEQFMEHRVAGVLSLGGRIVYVSLALGAVPRESATKETPVPNYVIADFFDPDFTGHVRRVFTRLQPWSRSLWHNQHTECGVRGAKVILNTLRWNSFLDLSGNWRDSYSDIMGRLFEIDETGIRDAGPAPDPDRQVYPDSKEYRFGQRIVRMASQFRMQCVDAASGPSWVLKLNSYLYTEIEERDGILYFGTAGKGGRCYGVSLADGSVAFDVNTGGTVRYAWWNGRLVCPGRKGELLVLDRANGAVLAGIPLGKLKVQCDDPLLVVGDRLYTKAFGKDASAAVMVDLGAMTMKCRGRQDSGIAD
jgi:hypothetical protein